MANLVLSWTDSAGNMVTIVADASITETHDSPAEVTDHPLETGGLTSDHIIKGADALSLEFLISNTPIRDPGDSMMRGAVGQKSQASLPSMTVPVLQRGATAGPQGPSAAQVSQSAQSLSVTVLQFSADFDRVKDVRDALKATQDEGILINVATTLAAYDSMGVVNVTIPRDAANGDSSVFTVDLKKVRYSTSQTTAAPVPSQPRGRARSNSGSQAAAPAAPTPRASTAYNALLGNR